MQPDRAPRFIVSGGGTGGHIFPAIAIADELRRLRPDAEFLFVGARGKMEMEKVPAAGYRIEGLWISGLQRRLTVDNLSFPVKVLSSLFRSRQILREFRPDVVIGTGGYAGGPVLYAAAQRGIPTLIQEPNAFAGLANKWLGGKVDKVCVAFAGMSKFFPSEKLVVTGNPVREQLLERARTMASDGPATVLLMGGSGGARSLNQAMAAATERIAARPEVRWVWQCGKNYLEDFRGTATAQLPNVTITAFLDRMDEAYAQATVVIGRAGSTTIAEIEYLGKPAILVPSPWVAEDHQTRNAEALTQRDAAVLVADADVVEKLIPEALGLIDNPARREQLGANAREQAKPGAVNRIAEEVLTLIASPTPKNNFHATV
ncbi:UDP-N-acetylglucosamine-N-acetylmuramylpentapeptide N-acetylglucosamine transferase [Neolewinella xylanilytica]|uniref:UDP-N-acetylglucosamine--N-acetylmuramyl-(pentapeptide) pyrophosphoryl-undecaprenol N-acetylglucosamine transferase n=1 Tax=Neolewinella xylanilytica TaxID=1514080 RepID=A0A2S6I4B2_9BACT|nr:undecaprenyldiphospho-muramoylpentapeptide beta-N-acetylglucosaminyltransferase [Neolewinella xylanilytica]PPK86022.1 UDP-N-acetylglucosamine-N-acetylmuramylpentapeptide N-acetylglucosamine transferase [Neolewinella xylanilytica]